MSCAIFDRIVIISNLIYIRTYVYDIIIIILIP